VSVNFQIQDAELTWRVRVRWGERVGIIVGFHHQTEIDKVPIGTTGTDVNQPTVTAAESKS